MKVYGDDDDEPSIVALDEHGLTYQEKSTTDVWVENEAGVHAVCSRPSRSQAKETSLNLASMLELHTY